MRTALLLIIIASSFAFADPTPYPDGIPDSLDRGHRLILKHGFQLQAMVFPWSYPAGQWWSATRWAESYFTTPNIHEAAGPFAFGPAPGIQWSRWMTWDNCRNGTPYLETNELSYIENLVALQAGDEQDIDNPSYENTWRDTYIIWKTNYPDVICYTTIIGNKYADSHVQVYQDYTKPDMLCMDNYEYLNGNGIVGGNQPKWYQALGQMRKCGMLGNDGTGNTPIPYSCYFQSFIWDRSGWRDMGLTEYSICQYAPLAFGYKFTIAFVYNDPDGDGTELTVQIFEGNGDQTTNKWFGRAAENNREIQRLTPALERLITRDDSGFNYVYFVSGQYLDGSVKNIPVPPYCAAWSASADPYITSISANNPGSYNNGLRGDVILGYFYPLHESFDGPDANNELYFMMLNGLTDVTAEPAQVMQQITLNFDFGASGITNLLRLSRSTGKPEVVNLTHSGGSQYTITLELDGGEGDLFKFNNGTPFVGNVDAPENIFPTNSAPVTAPATFTATPFKSSLGYSFTASQYQISTVSDFSVIAGDTGEIYPLDSYTASANAIPAGTYFWRVRYKNSVGVWSDWSLEPTSFQLISSPSTGTAFEDNFNVSGSGLANHNYNEANRQYGDSAPLLYKFAGGNTTVTNIGAYTGKCYFDGTPIPAYLTPDYNFKGSGDFSIEYELTRLSSGANWSTISFGTDAIFDFPHEVSGGHGMEIIFFENGWYNVYADNIRTGNFYFAELSATSTPKLKIKIVVSQPDFTGTGNAKVSLFINDKPYPMVGPGNDRYTYTFAGGFTNNYINFLTASTDATIDNLKIKPCSAGIATHSWTDDSNSGITTLNAEYSHAVNLADTASPIINGVPFTGAGSSQSGANWEIKTADGTALSQLSLGAFNYTPDAALEGRTLVTNVLYSGLDNAGSIVLTGLIPGQAYQFNFYSTAFEATGGRRSFISTSSGSTIQDIDQDEFDLLNCQVLTYNYIASDNGIFSVSTTPITEPWGFYAFGNKLLDETYLKITNGNFSVAENISQCSLGGTNNTKIAGIMSWYNSATGENGSFPAAGVWIANNIRLAFGDNLITVSGTNIYGAVSSDSVTINRNPFSNTIAYWRFEDGINVTIHPGNQDNWYKDISGHGNHLSSWWDGARPTATNDLPFSIVEQSQAENKLALDFKSADIGTFGAQTGGKMIESYMFNNGWTIECSFKLDTITWSSVINKDGKPSNTIGDTTFCLKFSDYDKKLNMIFFDNSINLHNIPSIAPIMPGNWYSVAATYDGTTAKLYLKGENDNDYILQGTAATTAGAAFGQWAGSWNVGRGMWNGGAADWIDGRIDEVRISNRALQTEQFLDAGDSTIPYINITNNNVTVDEITSTYTIGGTNNVKIVGAMSWQNELTKNSGNVSASPNWTVSDILLDPGENVITVSGTNIYGATSGDSVVITRDGVPEPGILIFIQLIAFAFFKKLNHNI